MSPRRQQHRQSYNEWGHAHELTFGCYCGFGFLERERVCNWLADAIQKVRQDQQMAVWAYVFMPNHVPLLIHFGRSEYDMASVLREIEWPVSRKVLAYRRQHAPEWLPKLQAQRGTKTGAHFWQRGSGYDRNVTEPQTLEKMIESIHLTPVRLWSTDCRTNRRWE